MVFANEAPAFQNGRGGERNVPALPYPGPNFSWDLPDSHYNNIFPRFQEQPAKSGEISGDMFHVKHEKEGKKKKRVEICFT